MMVMMMQSLLLGNGSDFVESFFYPFLRVMFLKEEADHFLSFFLEVCIICAQAAESQELGKRDAGFDTGVARGAVVKVGLRVSRFTVNGCREFSLFQGDVHVQESEGLLWGLEGEFDGGMEVLHKVDEIHKLFVAYLG